MELKHLAPYLPYGLKVLRPDNKTVLEVCGLTTYGSNKWHYHFKEDGNTIGDVHAKGNKPILRPLSDLTHEIEHKGKKFVPMVWLAKIQYPDVEFQTQLGRCIGRLNAGVLLQFTIQDEIAFYYEHNNNIFGLNNGEKCFMANIRPSETREYLLRWHFDVFGLIEKGEAIDINTL